MNFIRNYLAKRYLKQTGDSKFVAIGGTLGKSLTSKLINELVSSKFQIISTSGRQDSQTEILDAAWKGRKPNQKVLIELRPKTQADIDFYLKQVNPSLVILTNLLQDNPIFPGSEMIWSEFYRQILAKVKEDNIVINHEDVELRKLVKDLGLQPVYYGTDERVCHVWASRIRVEQFKTIYELNYGVERVEIATALLGEHLISDQLAAAAFALTNNLPLTTIKKVFEHTQGLAGHMEVSSGVSGTTIIDDSCQFSAESLEKAIETLNLVPAKRRVLISSCLPEATPDRDNHHKSIARKIYKDGVDYVYLLGKDAKDIGDELLKYGFPNDRLEFNLQPSQITTQLQKLLSKGDVVLVKADPQINLSEILNRLTKTR